MKHHPLAAIFPMMSEPELDLLAEDIKENGQREKIILLDGMILDGRNRHRACELAKVKPLTENYREKGITPIEYVMSKNLHRRHLTTAQRAISAALYKLEIQKAQGSRQHKFKEGDKIERGQGWAFEQALKMFKIGIGTLQRANVVVDKRPDLIKEVVEGRRTISNAYSETTGKRFKQLKAVEVYEPPPSVLTNSEGITVIHQMCKLGWDFELRRSKSGQWKAHFYGKDGSSALIVWSEKQTYPSFHTAVCAAAQEVADLKGVAA